MKAALSAATLRDLQNPAPCGQRHAQILRIAPALISAGLSNREVFDRLRANYDRSVPDAEIADVIYWAEKKARNKKSIFPHGCFFPKTPFRHLITGAANGSKNRENKTNSLTSECQRTINEFLQGFSCEEMDIFDASPIKLPADFREDASLAFNTLYLPSDRINIVSRYRQHGNNANEKAFPIGFGETFTRDEWLNRFRFDLIPQSKAGAWLRINPLNGNGITDEHVSDYRFVLLESDFLPIEIQFALLAKFPIPICAILKSGGKSIHAWVRIPATNAGEFREKVSQLFFLLSPFGFDSSNRNPSRLSRLPGAQRTIGATNDGKQRLLYLNPEPTERSIA